MAKIGKFLVLYLVQTACLWLGLETSTYFQGDALKVALQGYEFFFYALPVLTTGLIFPEVHDVPLSTLIGWTEQRCLAAYAQGKRAWQYNQFAFFFRRQWMLYLLVSSVLVFLSLHVVFFPTLSSALKNATILLLAFLFFSTHFFAFRRRTLRFLNMQEKLHQLSHQLRNEHSQLLQKLSSKAKASPEDTLCFLAEVLELIQGYVQIITNEKSIELAVRVALPHQEEQGNIIYQTLVRTPGLQESACFGGAVPANQGIPRYLIEERETCNVLVYKDIRKALQEQVFQEQGQVGTESISSLAVAPLRAWDGKKKSMIGMVYITSENKKTFCEEHVDGLRFLADILSDALASSITVNHMLIMKGNKNARRRQLLEKF